LGFLGIVVVCAGDRVGVLDLIAEGEGGSAVEQIGIGEERDITGDQCLEVGPGAAHDRLMVVVADRVLVGQELEIWLSGED
jgi:hypothetical protein